MQAKSFIEQRSPMFYVHYFTTRRHYEYLWMSVQSWRNLPNWDHIHSITLNIDCEAALSDEEFDSIRQNVPLHINRVATEEPMSHRGLNVIRNELRAFSRTVQGAGANDWIIKIDSDVIVTKSLHAFNHAGVSNGSMIGNPNGIFIQGGVYFLRVCEIGRLLASPLEDNYYGVSPAKAPEDKTMTQLMVRGGGRLDKTRLAWNEPMLEKLEIQPAKGTFLHFMGKSKANMQRGFEIQRERGASR